MALHGITGLSRTPSLGHPARAQCFTLQVRLRGQFGSPGEVSCSGLEEAIRFGEANFPAFAERNPWLALDSRQHQIWILLDPETESLRA